MKEFFVMGAIILGIAFWANGSLESFTHPETRTQRVLVQKIEPQEVSKEEIFFTLSIFLVAAMIIGLYVHKSDFSDEYE